MFVQALKINNLNPKNVGVSFGRRTPRRDFFLERRLKRQKMGTINEALHKETKRMQNLKLPYGLIVRYQKRVLNSVK